MGSGSWTRESFGSYSRQRARNVADDGSLKGNWTAQEMYTSTNLDPMLNPKNVIRECCDSDEHPNTIPVILALDVTGSMGDTAVRVATKLNVVMTKLYEQIKDVEFMIMGIGDFGYDKVPLQVSQFESDIRIAEQLDKLYFEGLGGGNGFESYTAAWYFGLRHTSLDCWKRGKKGIIITMGDEQLNPYIPLRGRRVTFSGVTGDIVQADIETKDLYEEAKEKFDIYHLNVCHKSDGDGGFRTKDPQIAPSFKKYLDDVHYREVTVTSIADEIVDIVLKSSATSATSWISIPTNISTNTPTENSSGVVKTEEGISW